MKIIPIILAILLACCGIAAAATYYPSSTSIDLIALESGQKFNATEIGSHNFQWYVNGTLVQTNSSVATATYNYPPTPWRKDTVRVVIDGGSSRTWYVDNGLNETAASRTVLAVTNVTLSINMSNYTLFSSVQTMDYNNTTQIADTVFLPITGYWLDPEVGIGYWFYAVLILCICGLFYWKFESMAMTSMVLLILSMAIAGPATLGTILVPSAFLNLMYIAVVLGVLGTFAGLLKE